MVTREYILNWMMEDKTRTVLSASVKFGIEVQKVHDILNKKDK